MFSYVHFLIAINYFRWSYTTFDCHSILLLASIYYFQCVYATFGSYNYFHPLYTTFDGYMLLQHYKLLLALPDCDCVGIHDFPIMSRICGLKSRLEFNINFSTLIQFGFFCSQMLSSANFDSFFC